MDSGHFFFNNNNPCNGNMLFLGNSDPVFRGRSLTAPFLILFFSSNNRVYTLHVVLDFLFLLVLVLFESYFFGIYVKF